MDPLLAKLAFTLRHPQLRAATRSQEYSIKLRASPADGAKAIFPAIGVTE